jgi:hypothetical protein
LSASDVTSENQKGSTRATQLNSEITTAGPGTAAGAPCNLHNSLPAVCGMHCSAAQKGARKVTEIPVQRLIDNFVRAAREELRFHFNGS